MTRKHKIIYLIIFLIFCLFCTVTWLIKNSPTFQARQLIAELNRENSTSSRFIKFIRRFGIRVNSSSRDYDVIIQDLVDLGESAFPVLIDTLIEDEEYILKLQIAEVFERHGSNARSVVPDLIEIITTSDDFSLQTLIALTLSLIGPDAVGQLVELLHEPNPRRQVLAAGALIEIDHNILYKPEILEVCISAITDSDPNTRVHAFHVLSMLGPDAEPAIGAIIEALKDPQRRNMAAYTLRKIGHSTIPFLLQIIDTPDPEILSAVIEILVDIDPELAAKELYPTLLHHLSSDHTVLQGQVLLALQFINPPPAEILPSLQKILQTENPDILTAALGLIESIGPPAATTVSELIRIVETQSSEVRLAALNAITSIGSAAQPVAPSLLVVLENCKDHQTRHAACVALMAIDPEAFADIIMPLLLNETTSVENEKRASAIDSLRQIGPPAAPALSILEQLLISPHDPEILSIASALIAIDPDHAGLSAFEIIQRYLESSSPEDRCQAVEILQTIDPAFEPVIPALIDALADDDLTVRYAAIKTLTAIGPDAQAATDALQKNLNHPNTSLRRDAARALRIIQR